MQFKRPFEGMGMMPPMPQRAPQERVEVPAKFDLSEDESILGRIKAEYQTCKNAKENPATPSWKARFKTLILEELLRAGNVDIAALQEDLMDQAGDWENDGEINEAAFHKALEEVYALNQGK